MNKPERIAKEKVAGYTVSTIRFGNVGTIETIVFKKAGGFHGGLGAEVWSDHWTNLEEAQAGHAAVVERLKNGWRP